jgi:hypothetical protein
VGDGHLARAGHGGQQGEEVERRLRRGQG